MSSSTETDVFKRANPALYYSSQFLPGNVRRDLYLLFGFILVMREYVELNPMRPDYVAQAMQLWELIKNNPNEAAQFKDISDPNELVMRDLAYLYTKYGFEASWIDTFFATLQSDLYSKNFETVQNTLDYLHGSSEVIGMCIAKIFRLHPDSYPHAQTMARSMSYVDLLCGLAKQAARGTCYFPLEDLSTFGLPDLQPNTAYKYPIAFKDFMLLQLSRCKEWEQSAEQGYRYMPRRYRAPVRTAVDIYQITAARIEANPFIVFEQNIKPQKWQIYRQGVFRLYYA